MDLLKFSKGALHSETRGRTSDTDLEVHRMLSRMVPLAHDMRFPKSANPIYMTV